MNHKNINDIQSPFLKRFIALYGNLGLHIRPLSRHDKMSYFSFLFNITFTILLNVFTLIVYHNEIVKNAKTLQIHKVIFSMTLRSISLLTPYFFDTCIAYFLIKGSQMTTQFDSPLFHLDSSSFLNQKWTVPVLFLFDQCLLLPIYYRALTHYKNPSKFTYNLLLVIANQTPNVPFRLLAYFKYLTWKTLQDFESSHSTLSSQLLRKKVAQLASLNQQLNCFFSFPLLVFTIFFSLQWLVFLNIILLNKFTINGILFLMPTVICVSGICYLSRQIELSIRRLSSLVFLNDSKHQLFAAQPTSTTAIIQFRHLNLIYGCYLQPKVFFLFTLNSNFLIVMAFQLLNYAVLLHQTN